MCYVYYQRFCSSAFFIIQHFSLCYYCQWCCVSSHHSATVQVAVWFLHWLHHSARAAYLLFSMFALLVPHWAFFRPNPKLHKVGLYKIFIQAAPSFIQSLYHGVYFCYFIAGINNGTIHKQDK